MNTTSERALPTTLQFMARELVDMVIGNLWDRGDVSSTAALASTCHYLAAVCQPLLFSDVTIRQRREGHYPHRDFKEKMLFLMELVRKHSHLCGYMKTLTLRSDLNEGNWMSTPSTVALVEVLYDRCQLVELTLAGKGPERLDGSQFHRSTLRRPPASLQKLTLENVCKLSTNIFSHISRVRSLSLLGVSFPGHPPQLPKSRSYTMATRNRVHPSSFAFDLRPELMDDGMRTACRIVRKWVSFDQVEKVSIHTGDEDEWMILNQILVDGVATIRSLEVELTGLGRAVHNLAGEVRFNECAPLRELRDLVLVTRYTTPRYNEQWLWSGVTFLLKKLTIPSLTTLTIRLLYTGRGRSDYLEMLGEIEEWNGLDKLLHDRMVQHPSLRVRFEFGGWDATSTARWSMGEVLECRRLARRLFEQAHYDEQVVFGRFSNKELLALLPSTASHVGRVVFACM